MKLDELERLEKAATPGEWASVLCCTEDEDEGCLVVSSVGPSYRFFPGDMGEYDVPEPMGLLLEDEANKRARADQQLIDAARNALPKLIAIARAAQDLERYTDLYGLNNDRFVLNLFAALADMEQP